MDVRVCEYLLNLESEECVEGTSWMRLEAISSCRMKSLVLMMIR